MSFVEKICSRNAPAKAARHHAGVVEIYFNFVGGISRLPAAGSRTPGGTGRTCKEGERKDRVNRTSLGAAKQTASRRNGKNATTPGARRNGGSKGAAIRAEDGGERHFSNVASYPGRKPRKATVSASAAV